MTKLLIIGLMASGLGLASSVAGPIFEPVAALQAGPVGPENGTLLKHSNGFFYGTSRSGGAYGNGCLYRVSRTGEVKALVHFTGAAGTSRGKRPQSGLVDDGTGVLWGTTFQGGAGNSGDGFGTVFKFNPVSSDFTSVVEFSGTVGFAKGSFPQAALVKDASGRMWGTTSMGGAGGHGTIFHINPTNLAFTTVLAFTGNAGINRGRNVLAPLVFDGTGTMWGTTAEGGSGGHGTLFSVNTGTSALATLVDFTGIAGAFPGSRAAAALVPGLPGTWWGTTSSGGAEGHGTIFRYTVPGGAFLSAAAFTGTGGSVPGRIPASALASDGQGNFLGTTNAGGAEDFGTIYKVNSATLTFTALRAFTGNGGAVPGSMPQAGLASDGAGYFWGVTVGGGRATQGTIYKVHATTGTYAGVGDFLRTPGRMPASNPRAGLTPGPDGLLWGSSERGGISNFGMLFTVNPGSGLMQRVLDFTGMDGPAKGSSPSAALVSDGGDFLWGVTAAGGSSNFGTLFKINVLTRVYTAVAEFTGLNGRTPLGRLIADGVGNLWGTTSEGGSGLKGTVFKVGITSGVLTTVVNFTGTGGNFLGDGPADGLTSDGAGFYWGSTVEGGTSNRGTIFKIGLATGTFTHVFSFDGNGTFPGDGPSAALTLDGAGFLWGVAEYGGAESHGVIFKINAATGLYTRILDFTGLEGDRPGANPVTSLMQDPVGAWYGTTDSGGASNFGTVFKISAKGVFTSIKQFTGPLGSSPGEKPRGGFMRHTDGHFYATTFAGGALDFITPGGNGSIYRLRLGPVEVSTQPASPVASGTATLKASVNPNGAASTIIFQYGTHPTLAGAAIVEAGTTAVVSESVNVQAVLTALLPSTVYYFRVSAVNPENANAQTGGILSFTTPSASGGGGGFVEWLTQAGIPGGVAAAGIDSDSDGTANALEYLQGTNPAAPNPPTNPGYERLGDQFQFTFQRPDATETPDVTLRVEVADTLGSWLSGYNVGATTAASDSGVVVEENGGNPDNIRVSIPMDGRTMRFARLKILIGP